MRTITTPIIMQPHIEVVVPPVEQPVVNDVEPAAEAPADDNEAPFDAEPVTVVEIKPEDVVDLGRLEAEQKLLDPIYKVEREIKSLIEQESDLAAQLEKIRDELKVSKSAKASLLEALPGRLLALRDGRDYVEPPKQALTSLEPVSAGWRSKPAASILEGIPRLGKTKLEAIVDQYPTVGDLADARVSALASRQHFCKVLPKGIGEGIADELTNRLMAIETGGDDRPCHEVVEPRTSDEAKRLQWVRATKKSIEASFDEEQLGANRTETWQDGYDDAHNGNDFVDCPDELTEEHQREWLRGWLFYDLEHQKKGETETEAASVATEDLADETEDSVEAGEAPPVNEQAEDSKPLDLHELAEAIKSYGEPLTARVSAEAYGAGFDAAIDEQPLEACPPSLSEDESADWLRGWLAAQDNEGL